MPKINRYLRKGEANPIEGYVLFSCISMVILQILSIKYSDKIGAIRYLKTPSKGVLSEATIAIHIRHIILLSLGKNQDLSITKIIKEKQEEAKKTEFIQAS